MKFRGWESEVSKIPSRAKGRGDGKNPGGEGVPCFFCSTLSAAVYAVPAVLALICPYCAAIAGIVRHTHSHKQA